MNFISNNVGQAFMLAATRMSVRTVTAIINRRQKHNRYGDYQSPDGDEMKLYETGRHQSVPACIFIYRINQPFEILSQIPLKKLTIASMKFLKPSEILSIVLPFSRRSVALR